MLLHDGMRIAPSDLVIGLVNNLPTAAKQASERQFRTLLNASALMAGRRIALVTIEALAARTDQAFALLGDVRPDALIVTGAEPRAGAITDEPIWPALARLVDWSGDHTVSTLWSCLAAHAAVFRLDQISRVALPQKLSGVFDCMKATEHHLLAGAPAQWPVPQSRCNGLDPVPLQRHGYTLLSHAPDVGVDSFAKNVGASLFVFLQGHPEYGPDSLLGEYRRDVRRFLNAQRRQYPEMPANYFGPDTAAALLRLREAAERSPDLGLLATFDTAVAGVRLQPWHARAARLFANWLAFIGDMKADAASSRDWSHQRRVAS